MHMGGTSDPLFRCFNRLIKANVLGTTLLGTGSHVICLLANEMSMKSLVRPMKGHVLGNKSRVTQALGTTTPR